MGHECQLRAHFLPITIPEEPALLWIHRWHHPKLVVGASWAQYTGAIQTALNSTVRLNLGVCGNQSIRLGQLFSEKGYATKGEPRPCDVTSWGHSWEMHTHASDTTLPKGTQCPLTQQINDDRIAQQQRESHQNPGQEGGLEVKKPEEVHADVRVPAAPHVHQHDGESLAQEEEACKEAEELRATESRRTAHSAYATAQSSRTEDGTIS